MRFFNYEVVCEQWFPMKDRTDWQYGWEFLRDKYDTRLFWFGPLHIAVCRL